MKKILVLSIALFSIQSMPVMADSAVFNAKAFNGNSNYTKLSPTECTFASVNLKGSTIGQTVRVYLNADEASNINYAIDIPAKDIPLKNGYLIKPYNNILISYNNGVLHSEESRDAEMGPRGKIIETIDIQVSPDLQAPTGVAHANSVFKDLFHPIGKVDQELHCQFN